MDNPETLATLGTQDTVRRLEKTKGPIKNGQSRDTDSKGYTGYITKVRKSKGAIKNGSSRDTGNIVHTGYSTKVRESQRANHEWTIQRYWQHWVHRIQYEG